MECVCEGLEMLLSVPPLPDCCSEERLDDPSWGSGLADERQEQTAGAVGLQETGK